MIYSTWKPSKGGYDYFDGKDRDIPIANDLPVPSMPSGTKVGVASIECGRPKPMGSKYIGSGTIAKGMITPTRAGKALGVISDYVSPPLLWLSAGLGISILIRKLKK